MTAPQQEPHPVPEHIPEHLRDTFAQTSGRAVSPHCPYKSGDPVKRHGYPGHPDPGFGRTGFRGWVVGTVGATILTGITTAGEEWWEPWGVLEPIDAPLRVWNHCTCCAEERRPLQRAAYARARAQGQQLDLLTDTDPPAGRSPTA